MNWNVQRDGPKRASYFKFKWMENIVWAVAPRLLGSFTWELAPNSTETQDLEANADIGVQNVLPESSDRPNSGADVKAVGLNSTTQITDGIHPIYICLYERKDNFWRLRHAKLCQNLGVSVSQAQGSQPKTSSALAMESRLELPFISPDTPNRANMNRELFNALREKVLAKSPSKPIPWELNSVWIWKSWLPPLTWKFKTMLKKSYNWLCRRFDPVVVSGLEFWEV